MANVWNEAMSRNSNMTDVQPWTVSPVTQLLNTQTLIPIKTTNNMIPINAIMRIGRTDNDVMPLIAREIILGKVYLVSPCSRGSRSNAMVAVLKPS